MTHIMTPKQYRNLFDQHPGSLEEKCKHILTHYSHRWGWDGSETMVIDMLDDTTITAEDIVETLADAAEYDELNLEGRNAYIGLKLGVMKRPVLTADSISVESWMIEDTGITAPSSSGYESGSRHFSDFLD